MKRPRISRSSAARLVVLATGLMLVLATPLQAEVKPSPRVSFSLRGLATETVEQGEPWRVAVRLDLPRGSKESVVLSPAAGTWTDAIAVELYPESGGAAVARAVAVGKPTTNQATLDGQQIAGGFWSFPADVMESVAPGNYLVRVRLSIADGSGWTGMAVAREMPLKVLAPAARPSVQRITNSAQDLLLAEKTQEAAALVDAELKAAPREYALLRVRAEIAEQAGNPLAAIMCLNAANFSAAKNITGQPSGEDGEMLARLHKARGTAPANPPAWTWPPQDVLLALADEAKKSGYISAASLDLTQRAPNEPKPTPLNVSPPPPAVPPTPVSSSVTSPAATPLGSTASVVTVPIAAVPSAVVSAEPPIGRVVPAAELSDARIVADKSGQWATSATAGSQYGKSQYAAAQATGAPNISVAGNSPEAWCPASQNAGTDWLSVAFTRPVHATEVRVRQNNAVGAITKIEAIEADGTTHVWWNGVDPSPPPAVRDIVWFAVRVPATSYLVSKVKITLNLAAGTGWKQIDAVQLVGTAP